MNESTKSTNLPTKSLLIVAHTPSPNTIEMANAILAGAQNELLENVEAELASPFDCDSQKVLASDGIILFTTENFGYMSGALKDFFERIYYPCLSDESRNDAKPFAVVIKAGLDGTGTKVSINKIVTGLKWKQIQETIICKGNYEPHFLEQCQTLGLTVAASLDAGIV